MSSSQQDVDWVYYAGGESIPVEEVTARVERQRSQGGTYIDEVDSACGA